MKASNIIIFIIVVIIIVGIFGFAMWDMRNNETQEESNNDIEVNEILNETIENTTNTEITNTNTGTTTTTQSLRAYKGEWYISQQAYINAELIDELMERREDNLITMEELENQLQNLTNDEIAELEVDECFENRIKFDFKLTGPAPTQREAKIENIIVELTDGVGTFSYTDNWGTTGSGTITLGDEKIELELNTTEAGQNALWGVEGTYTFTYKIHD